jgi:hypothetical protein
VRSFIGFLLYSSDPWKWDVCIHQIFFTFILWLQLYAQVSSPIGVLSVGSSKHTRCLEVSMCISFLYSSW